MRTRTPKVRRWFAQRRRYHLHFTPKGTNWLNTVERFFAEITRQRIRRGTFGSVPELVLAIQDYVRHHNRQARPFLWTAGASSIQLKIRHGNRVNAVVPSGLPPGEQPGGGGSAYRSAALSTLPFDNWRFSPATGGRS